MSIRSAIRSALRARSTSIAIAGFAAIGIAAVVIAFNLADAALWRSPPLRDPARLVLIHSTHKTPNTVERRARWSYARIQEIKKRARGFAHVANFTSGSPTLSTGDAAEMVSCEYVSPEYFRVADVRAVRGRLLLASDDLVGNGQPVVVVSEEFWRRQLQQRADVVGATLKLEGHTFVIVGVAQEGFRGFSGTAQLWLPATTAPAISYPEYLTTDQDFINVVAKLQPGVSVEQARSDMLRLGAEVYAAAPVQQPDVGLQSGAGLATLQELRVSATTRRSVLILLAAVGFLHLLACANVASLLLGKAAARRREIAIRQALGATRARLLPEVMTEGVLLVVVGGLAGTLFAAWATTLLPAADQLWRAQGPNPAIGTFAEPGFGLRGIMFSLAVIAVTVCLVCWAPAAGLLRLDMPSSLRDGARGYTFGGSTLRRPTLRGVIVAVEGALAVVLLMAGSLMIDSFARMRRTDLGVESSHVLTFDLRVPDAKVSTENAPAFITRVLAAITAVPGVVSASVDGGAPVSGSAISTLFVGGRPPAAPDLAPVVLRHYVGPDHFRTLGIPLLAGRTFTARDVDGQPRVVIISEMAAKRFWPGENPIGKRLWFGGGSSFNSPERSGEIVGVVGDVAYQPLDREPFRPDFYTPYTQFTYASRVVFIRTAGAPYSVVGSVREAMKRVAPEIALRNVQSLDALIGQSWTRQRFDALLFGIFAALALMLSASGIYAVVSYAVGQRTREMGIRIALGASKAAVVKMVVREGMVFPAVGLSVGLLLALALSRVVAASLYEVSPTDPAVIVRALCIIIAGSVFACLLPALRATRVDPLTAIRVDG